MAYDSNTQTIIAPVDIGDISTAIRVDSLDLGTLCLSSEVKGFARYKPLLSPALAELTDDDRKALNYGWNIPDVLMLSLRNSGSAWSRISPSGGCYRMLDFVNYYHDAPEEVLSQCVGSSMAFNAMNPYPGIIAFYFFNRTGQLKDRQKYSTGLTTLPYGRSEYQLERCVGLEDLETSNGHFIYKDGTQLGVIFWDKDAASFESPIAEAWCDELILPTDGTYDEAELVKMYRKELIDLVLPSGEYNAVFCLRIPTDEAGDDIGGLTPVLPTGKTYRYVRVQDVSGYPSIVPVTVSGADKMQYTIQGLATSYSSYSWVTTLNTKGNVAYAKAIITNKSGITITNTDTFQDRWNAKITIKGNKVISGASTATSINTVATAKIYRWRYSGESTWRDGNTSYISLGHNKSVETIYQINDIWNLGELLSPLSSGMVSVGITPRFDEDSFTYGGGTQLQALTINYA